MARAKKIKSPTQLELVEPLFAVLVELGGSATIDEIRDNIIKKLKLSDDVVDEPHKGNASQQTELEYQLAWARTRLKNLGAIVNSKRDVWDDHPGVCGTQIHSSGRSDREYQGHEAEGQNREGGRYDSPRRRSLQ